jgi:hypothetical protein
MERVYRIPAWEQVRPSLVIDPVRGPLIARMFELIATGEHTKASALAAVTALGLLSHKGRPLTQETIRKLLVNRLCMGEMFIEGWGQCVKGDFEPLVSESVFDRVQTVLSGRAPAPVAHVREREDFLFAVGFSAPSVRSSSLPASAQASSGTSLGITGDTASRGTSTRKLRRSRWRS